MVTEVDTSFFDTFLGPGLEQWVEDLVFLGPRVQIDPDTGREYEEADVPTLVPNCIVQPYGDDRISLIPEGVRERVEKLVIVPPGAPIKKTDRVKDSEGYDHQIVRFKNWKTHFQLTVRQH